MRGLIFICLAFLAFLTGFCGEGILYWMVDDNATVEKNGVTTSAYSYFECYAAQEGSAFAARVRVTGGNITDDTFLDLYWGTEFGGVDEGGGYWGVEFGEVGGYWGAGVPTGNQSPVQVYSEGSPEYSFTMELGNIDSDDNWTTVATSASRSYSSLGDYIHQTFDINPSQLAVWTPTRFYAEGSVPEPSSALLCMIGLGLIGLMRKKRGSCES